MNDNAALHKQGERRRSSPFFSVHHERSGLWTNVETNKLPRSEAALGAPVASRGRVDEFRILDRVASRGRVDEFRILDQGHRPRFLPKPLSDQSSALIVTHYIVQRTSLGCMLSEQLNGGRLRAFLRDAPLNPFRLLSLHIGHEVDKLLCLV